MHPILATKTAAGRLPALLCRRFDRRDRRCSGLLRGNRQIAPLPRVGQTPHHECVAIGQPGKESWNFMKPCSNNRKPLALLAVDALSASDQRELRAHIQICDGCRDYLREISSVTQKLTAVETRSQIQTSEAFHQRAVPSLKAQENAATWTFLH